MHDAGKTIINTAGGIPALVALLDSTTPEVQQHAVDAIQELSQNDANKRAMIADGAVPALQTLSDWSTPLLEKDAAQALKKLGLNRTVQWIVRIGCGLLAGLVGGLGLYRWLVRSDRTGCR
uniref:Armadillo repeat-containing domain-containing protein n=1 Tax=Eutreptiella gymnastica TaxID=73025 RepID=A0A6T1V9N5_9EUGL